jgi:hypothetical protein
VKGDGRQVHQGRGNLAAAQGEAGRIEYPAGEAFIMDERCSGN